MPTDLQPQNKDLRELVRQFKKGYTLRPTGGSHFSVIDPTGRIVRVPGSGQLLTLPSTPHRSRLVEHRLRLEAAGVIGEEEKEQKERETLEDLPFHLTELDDHAERTKELKKMLDRLHVSDSQRYMLVEVVKYVNPDKPLEELTELVNNLMEGDVLNKAQREPFQKVAKHLTEGEGDVIEKFYGLLRLARGLPVGKEPEPLPEREPDLVAPTVQPTRTETPMAATPTSQKVADLISDLTEDKRRLEKEVQDIQDLIDTLESRYPSIQLAMPDEREREYNPPPPRHVPPPPDYDSDTITPPRRQPTTELRGDELKEKIFNIMDEGGEWNMQELTDRAGLSSHTTTRKHVKDLLEEGRVVLVTPQKGGGPRGNPATYGTINHYAAN